MREVDLKSLRGLAYRHLGQRLAVECGLSFEQLRAFVGGANTLSEAQAQRLLKRVRVLETRDFAEKQHG